MVILLAGVVVALVPLVVMVLVATEAVAGTVLAGTHHPKEQMALAGAVEVALQQGNLAEVVMV
jgi:hypothetical protein